MINKKFLLSAILVASLPVGAQEVVHVGKGSYASYTPLYICRSEDYVEADHGGWDGKGDQSRDMQTRKLYLNERDGQPIPTNDWWTNLITKQYSGNLWSYPQMIKAHENGLDIQQPSFWIADGTEMKSNTVLTVGGDKFKPASAIADHWHDWDVEFSMKDGNKEMYVTMAHGIPFTWMETKGFNPTLQLAKSGWTNDGVYVDTDTHYLDASGNPINESIKTDRIIMERGGDLYGIYVPKGSTITIGSGNATVNYPESTNGYVVVAMLHQVSDLNDMAKYALAVPRDTRVDWKYDGKGKMETTWHVDAENIATGEKATEVLQGFLPHQYRDTGYDGTLALTGDTYKTPHGVLKMAAGNDFKVDYKFYGMLPYWALPDAGDSDKNPYDVAKMKEMLARYAETGSFGADTYWGGKGLVQMALYMMMAREMGEKELFEQCRNRLKEAMVNWLTYTPGEKNFFFARYDRWGALVGYQTSYDSETFNDHHFHYGYFTMAGALLALVDDDFRDNYGQMLRLVAKDYANWQHTDNRFPFFRTFDPWAGHSFAGGMGDDNGNGQESSSEAMQSWGGLYMLGMALGDNEMRDAGIFGWLSEARGVAEYWFDRHRDNIDYTKFKHPYNSNLTCQGVGYWTYFGYQNVYMQGIQWMPTSTALDYLSEDKKFAKWDYEMLFDDPSKNEKGNASNGRWFDESFDEKYASRLDKSGDWGNVTLSYLQRSDPDEAARLFDLLWEKNNDIAKTSGTNGISYFSTHSHLTNGDLDWTITADIPTARVYKKGDKKTHMAYNPTENPISVHFSDGFTLENIPARQLTVEGKESKAVTEIVREAAPEDVRENLLMPNLALHKPCTESSSENDGMTANFATDGDDGTRWGSKHEDNQWIQVDLQQESSLYKVNLHWEAAYPSEYEIALSDDGVNWTYKQKVNSTGGWDEIKLGDHKGRYLRITGIKRATAYGISLYEIQAFGKAEGISDDAILGIQVTADKDVLKQDKPSQLTVKGYTNKGEWKNVSAHFTTEDGSISDNGVFTPSIYGTATIRVKLDSGDDIFTQSFPVEEAIYVRYLTLSPNYVQVVADGKTPTEVTVEAKDQFKGPFNLQEGGNLKFDFYAGEKDADGKFAAAPVSDDDIRYDESQQAIFANKPGKYSMVAYVAGKENIADTILVEARNFADINLALMKPATASTVIGDGSTASKAVDGDQTGSRWESAWGNTEEWLQVDLEKVYTINKVVVYWEAARAAEYDLQVSLDGEQWTTIKNVKDSPTGGETIDFSPVDARYVRIQGITKALPAYGYSIYELEVYGTKVVTGIHGIEQENPASTTIYDLNGRKVGTAKDKNRLQKGVYIVGNKKQVF